MDINDLDYGEYHVLSLDCATQQRLEAIMRDVESRLEDPDSAVCIVVWDREDTKRAVVLLPIPVEGSVIMNCRDAQKLVKDLLDSMRGDIVVASSPNYPSDPACPCRQRPRR